MNAIPSSHPLAGLLFEARRAGRSIPTPDSQLVPTSSADAYAIQRESIALRGSRVVGWKVGSKSADGPIQGSPLPSDAFHASPGAIRRANDGAQGLELEIAFRLGRSFAPADEPYSNEEVLESITAMAAAVEVVSSRYAEWPRVAPLLQLADLQNHGALCVGEAVAYDPAYPFEAPSTRFEFDGANVVLARPRNPAGDPRRLLHWLVNHVTAGGVAFAEGLWVTTGSYTGLFFPEAAGTAVGRFDGMPEVRLALEGG